MPANPGIIPIPRFPADKEKARIAFETAEGVKRLAALLDPNEFTFFMNGLLRDARATGCYRPMSGGGRD
jgi:hypothetical protein